MGEMMLNNKRILLIISGGIAAYKALEFIRRLKDRGCQVRCILTEGGTEFVTPLSVAALSGEKVYTDLFSLTDEAEMGHIRLSREVDLVVVAPASADILAKMAAGLANDLATTALLATDKPVMVAPAMNIEMWAHPATRRNIATLLSDDIKVVGPAEGDLACGETGPGRMVEPDQLLRAVANLLADGDVRSLAGRTALVTSGPTREALDPVRYISNFSSGKQGHAIAAGLGGLGGGDHFGVRSHARTGALGSNDGPRRIGGGHDGGLRSGASGRYCGMRGGGVGLAGVVARGSKNQEIQWGSTKLQSDREPGCPCVTRKTPAASTTSGGWICRRN